MHMQPIDTRGCSGDCTEQGCLFITALGGPVCFLSDSSDCSNLFCSDTQGISFPNDSHASEKHCTDSCQFALWHWESSLTVFRGLQQKGVLMAPLRLTLLWHKLLWTGPHLMYLMKWALACKSALHHFFIKLSLRCLKTLQFFLCYPAPDAGTFHLLDQRWGNLFGPAGKPGHLSLWPTLTGILTDRAALLLVTWSALECPDSLLLLLRWWLTCARSGMRRRASGAATFSAWTTTQ